MIWNKSEVLKRLCYWEAYKNYAADYHRTTELPVIPKRKQSRFEPRFVTQAIDNAFFDEAFGILTELEQELLVKLYMDGSEDLSTKTETRIIIKQEVFDAVAKENGMERAELGKAVNEAIETMLEYLNGEE